MYVSTITFEEIVEEQIEILYDFHILRHKSGASDSREERVRKMLLACGNENRIETALYNVKRRNQTLNELLEMKGF